jgi:predicted RNase H-like HicB family nuclease
LEQVYAAILYYLRNRPQMDAYLADWLEWGHRVREEQRQNPPAKKPDDEGYVAYSPSLPGCFSNGLTIEETRRNIRAAIQQHIEVLQTHNQPVPQHERLVHMERAAQSRFLRHGRRRGQLRKRGCAYKKLTNSSIVRPALRI